MNIETIPYNQYLESIPQSGHHILAQQRTDEILVYQAFNPRIAKYAIEHQKFGGDHYSFSRMTWIKPNFLWMMYRCGWAEKEAQKQVLGIWIRKEGFVQILEEAVYSAYKEDIYHNIDNWKAKLKASNVRLQWDPDHDIYGEKQARRAIQLGLRGEIQKTFNDDMIVEIINITPFVKEEKAKIDKGEIASLLVPQEAVFLTGNEELDTRLRLGMGN
ncbi:MAG: DUF4291 domain-containing protein [Bacteroidia bacterium]